MGVEMTDTNLTQRNNADWLDSTADLVRRAEQEARDLEWLTLGVGPCWFEAKAARQRADAIASRFAAGETLTPRF